MNHEIDPVLFSQRKYAMRKAIDRTMRCACWIAPVLAVTPLMAVLVLIVVNGLPSLDWSFFSGLPKPVGDPGGGMGNALLGSIILVGGAALIAVPWGVMAGAWLSEFGEGRFASGVRLAADLTTSIPSIVIGLFVYTLAVVPLRHFSTMAGSLALSIIMVPNIARATEEILRLIPLNVREAGLALGLTRRRVITSIVIKGALRPISTIVLLAVARAAGETAPLLFTAFNNRFWNVDPMEPMASLPVQIYNYAISPFDEWHRQAWAGACLLLVLVFVVNLVTRALIGNARRSS